MKVSKDSTSSIKRGFTLVELIITISITIVAGYLLVIILGQSNGIFLKQSSAITEGMNANDAESLINEAIKQAAAVSISSPTTPVYTSNINTLVLAVPSIDSSGNIIGNSFDYYVIAADSSLPAVLRYQIFPTMPSSRKKANRVLLTNLSSLRFLYLDASGHQVSPASATQVNYVLNLSQKAGLVYQQASISSQISLRND